MFGREPLPGRVKSRLATAIGPEAAARVYEELLRYTLRVAAGAGGVVLSLADAPSEGWFPVQEPPPFLEVQRGADLGERMGDAFARRFDEGAAQVVVIGSDCPGLRAEHLAAAFDALRAVPAVLGPALDGGYWLVGQRAPGGDMFRGVPWSTPRTLAATRERLHRLGVQWRELDELDDIDRVEDLERALADEHVSPELRTRLRAVLDVM